jgi:hypothetical protein
MIVTAIAAPRVAPTAVELSIKRETLQWRGHPEKK